MNPTLGSADGPRQPPSGDEPAPEPPFPRTGSRQSSLSADSEEVRVLGAPLSDRSESEEKGQRRKILVDEEGRNVDEEEEREEEGGLERREEDSLKEFEEQEREVARQLAMEEEGGGGGGSEGEEGPQLMEDILEEEEEEEQGEDEAGEQGSIDGEEGLPDPERWGVEADELPRSSQSRVSESLQNRQFPGSAILQDELQLKQRLDSAASRHSSIGADPPPAYTSPRAISRGRLFVGERPNMASAFGRSMASDGAEEEEERTSVEGFAVPSPRLDGSKRAARAQEMEKEEEQQQQRSAAAVREAIGSSFALAGGMAAAVAATVQMGSGPAGGHQMAPIGRTSARESPRLLVQGARTAADLGRKEERPESGRSSSGKGRSGESGQQQQRFPVGAELKALFGHIEEFVAERIEIEAMLRPFQIDYIPAVGDVDPFIKVPRPDENDELQLGLAVLDEPAAAQSDPAIVDLRLHQMAGKSGSADAPVKKLSRADKNAHQIDRWVQSVRELRRTKPPDRVHYSKPMPSIDALMQEWPQGVEQNLKGVKLLLNANLDAVLEDYVDLCLALVDVPLHKSRLEALHLFFSLYAEFRNSQHFRNLALGQEGDRGETAPTVDNFVLDEGAAMAGGEKGDRLEIGT